jgi:hypothetical protein
VAVPAEWFLYVHVDLVVPLPASEDATYVFTVMDRNTRWVEVLPLSDISAKSCAAVLVLDWIARYGMSAVITIQFTSAHCDCLCTTLGIKHVQTTAYHPQANRIVE